MEFLSHQINQLLKRSIVLQEILLLCLRSYFRSVEESDSRPSKADNQNWPSQFEDQIVPFLIKEFLDPSELRLIRMLIIFEQFCKVCIILKSISIKVGSLPAAVTARSSNKVFLPPDNGRRHDHNDQ